MLCSNNTLAQTFPIYAQLVALPPHSMYLSDYSTSNNIQLHLIQRDMNTTEQEIYLNIELEGAGVRLKTLPNYRPSSYIEIVPGSMLSLGNVDLAEYLIMPALNFEGLSQESFVARNQQLPEGLYKLKIKAFFKFSGAQASNETMALMSLYRGQPPVISFPTHNGKVPEHPMQGFQIQWINRNVAGGWISQPSYRIQMWEMTDASQDPNIVVHSAYPPILDEYCNVTSFMYGPSQTALVAGKSYALRVQVLDPESRDLYSHNGYSQVVKFTYGEACNPPTGLVATLDRRQINYAWANTPGQGYHVQYGRIDTAWTETKVLVNRFSLKNPYPRAQYRMQVATICGVDRLSAYTTVIFTDVPGTGPQSQASCGDPFPNIKLKNKQLLPSIKIGDKFTAYDFDITVTQVIRNDSNGYAGVGKTPFMLLGGIDAVVAFDDIRINADRQLIEGRVNFQQKPYVFSDTKVEQFLNDFEKTKEMLIQNDVAKPIDFEVAFVIGTVTYDSAKKQIVVHNIARNSFTALQSGQNYQIKDKDGNIFLVSKDNQISKQSKATESIVQNGGPLAAGGQNTLLYFSEDQAIVSFLSHPTQALGYDAASLNSMASSQYEAIRKDFGYYLVPIKAVPSAGIDKVLAKLESNPTNVEAKKIKFKTDKGVAIPFTYDVLAQQWTLTLSGSLHRQDFSVYAYYGSGGKDTLCGKLNVMPLDHKVINVVMIPLNTYKTTQLKISELETYINRIFSQANIQCKLTLSKAFKSTVKESISEADGTLSGSYSAAQAEVIGQYIAAHPEQENTLYLFLCKEGSNSMAKGYTPLNRSYGFLFGENIGYRTIAHELGHGYPLALTHNFLDNESAGKYSNLMDDGSGTNLSFVQWSLAHNPKLKVRFGQDVE